MFCMTLHLPIKISFGFNSENAVHSSTDSTTKFPDIRFAISPGKIVQISCKTSCSRDNFVHFENISEQLTVFSFSGHLVTVNTVLYVYRDNEPVQGRI